MGIQRFLVGSTASAGVAFLLAATAAAGPITLFSTGNPDGRIATASRPANAGLAQSETETADDFILGQGALVSGATFTGLLPTGAALSTIQNVEIELYHVFPTDSTNPPSGTVPTRTNSPSDNDFAAFNQASGDITVAASIVSTSFTASNSVISGINPSPNQTTGGEGPVTGEEVLFTVAFNTPFFVGATDHDFFRPEVGLSSGSFLWLSAPKPIVSGTPFSPDLQAWIRNTNLDPDWLRVGTDIVGGATPPTYNMAFSLTGTPVPEPSSLGLLGLGLAALAYRRVRSS
jgi:hypothetical protein